MQVALKSRDVTRTMTVTWAIANLVYRRRVCQTGPTIRRCKLCYAFTTNRNSNMSTTLENSFMIFTPPCGLSRDLVNLASKDANIARVTKLPQNGEILLKYLNRYLYILRLLMQDSQGQATVPRAR